MNVVGGEKLIKQMLKKICCLVFKQVQNYYYYIEWATDIFPDINKCKRS